MWTIAVCFHFFMALSKSIFGVRAEARRPFME
jgi:hypothetical protein